MCWNFVLDTDFTAGRNPTEKISTIESEYVPRLLPY